MEGTSRFCIFDENIISDLFGEEVVLVNLESGMYFSLRTTATQAWIRLQNNYSIDEIIEELGNLYEVTNEELSKQTNDFIQGLIDKKLIKLSDATEKKPVAINDNQQKVAFMPIVLEVFSDMQEILILDPVHDVDKSGWPISKDNNSLK
jgi:hypothetical protein